MGRYVQQISLVPFSTVDMWVGWELEGVDGEVDGLVLASTLSTSELARRGVYDFQFIPASYVDDIRMEVKKKSADSSPAGSENELRNVVRAEGSYVPRYVTPRNDR